MGTGKTLAWAGQPGYPFGKFQACEGLFLKTKTKELKPETKQTNKEKNLGTGETDCLVNKHLMHWGKDQSSDIRTHVNARLSMVATLSFQYSEGRIRRFLEQAS